MTEQTTNESVARTPARPRRPPFILIGSIILLALCGVISFSAFNIFKGTRSAPLSFEQYPGSQLVRENKTDFSDQKLFSTTASIQDVLNFYMQKFPKSSDDTNGCKKIYLDTKNPSEEPGQWYGSCILDSSLLDVSQSLSITINYQALDGSTDKRTYYAVERHWGRQ